MFSPSVRGNVLDLTHIWADADGPDSPYQPVPSHLRLIWNDGLPYWGGLTSSDLAAMERTALGIEQLLTRQQIRLKWLPFQKYPDLYPAFNVDEQLQDTQLFPAYVLVAIPVKFRMPSPRYNHTHTQDEMKNHPPIKVRWPEPGFNGLRDFLVEAMLLEGIAAWGWPTTRKLLGKAPAIQLEGSSYLGAFVASIAPWFAASASPLSEIEATNLESNQLLASQSPEIKHIGTAIAKLDFYLFAQP